MGKGKAKDKNNNKRYGMLEEQAITVNIFLKRCLGLYNDELMNARLTHKDLAKIFPNLKRTSYAAILNDPSLIYTGRVVGVIDSNGELIPYINTETKKFLATDEFSYVMQQEEWSESPETWHNENIEHAQSYELSEMSLYKLELLMRLYEKTGQMKDHEIVRREIVNRRDSKRACNISKQKALRKSMKKTKKDDEY